MVDFRLKELCDEGHEDFTEDGGPFLVVRRGEVVGEEGALERAEGLLADFAAGVQALMREGLEDWGPVGCPCCGLLVTELLSVAHRSVPSVVSR